MTTKICNMDLYNKQYDIATLEANIDELGLKLILCTQHLTPEFCVKYILNENYAWLEEDTEIGDGHILFWQKHITIEHLDAVRKNNG